MMTSSRSKDCSLRTKSYLKPQVRLPLGMGEPMSQEGSIYM